jgi:hypothetical protein
MLWDASKCFTARAKQLMAYLRSHPEVERLSLLIPEGEDGAECVDISGAETTRVRNGVPLFPDMPNPVPVTVELVNQLLYEEEATYRLTCPM